MTVYRNEGRWDTSNVEFTQGRILAYDKANRTPRMRHIDYGLGVFLPRRLTSTGGPADRPGRGLPGFFAPRSTGCVRDRPNVSTRSARLRASTNSGVSEIMRFTEEYLAESAEILRRLDGGRGTMAVRWRHPAPAADGCSSWAWVAARPTRRMRSTTSARSAGWRHTRPPTTSAN